MYQITSNGFYFGLSLNGEELLPCNNNRIWKLTDDLVGFRQGDWFGLFSLEQGKVVHDPTILAAMPYFTKINNEEGRPERPRVNSEYGEFDKHKIYLERCDYLFWNNNSLRLLTTDGLVEIHKRKGILDMELPEEITRIRRKQASKHCVYDDEYGAPAAGRTFQFRYNSSYDEQLDEARTIAGIDDLIASLELDAPEDEDDDAEFPDYKVYDYNAIPAVIKEKFQHHLDQLSNRKAPEWLTPVLIFLAWCHANKYVTYTKTGEMLIDPYYEMPSEDAAHVIDAPGLYKMHDLQHLEHLLYVSPVTGTYYDVLAFEN